MLKKWTRVIRQKIKRCYQGRGKGKPEYPYEDETIPAWVAPIIIGVALALFYAMYANYQALPTPLMIKDEETHPDRFIAENAQRYLLNLTSIGVRVGGSPENDEKAVELLQVLLKEIKAQMQETHNLDIETQFQYNVTDFRLEFEPYGMTTVFKGCVNVLARITPKKVHSEYSGKCLLINSHFDTMPDTVGASDAGAMIAIMLEILRVMVTNPEVYKHCVIFLFNGGEENYMLGSYSFIKHHEWAADVAAFINLDAAGAGGREIMFQAGPNRQDQTLK